MKGENMKTEVQLQSEIKKTVESHPVVVYMKGTPGAPQCGFSAATINALKSYNVPIHAVDVLADMEAREGVKRFTNWPTIPQVFIKGKFIGGCDIITEMHENGELEPLIKEATTAA